MNHSSASSGNRQNLSFLKSKWVLPDVKLDQVELFSRRFSLPEPVARLLIHRGLQESEVEGFLNPTLKDHFPDPFSLVGMKAMADDVAKAIDEKKSFAIFGDFDVDGATSSAVMYRFLKHCGIEAQVYIPQRLTEGYGPNVEALKSLKETGAEVLFILDCGITAFETVQAGTDMGLKIIIIDHHEAEEKLPNAWHVINPKRKDDESGLGMLAAIGVTFLSCVAINASLRDQGFFEANGIPEAPLKDHLDLVGLGTVCDMVPIVEANRLLVRFGFKQMNQTKNIGLQALIQVSGINGALNTYHAGFVLGPRINAGSRVHQSDLGAKLLATEDTEEAKNIAWMLQDCNEKRKAIQSEMEQEAIGMVEAQGLADAPVIIVGHENWHSGLSGLVAGRLKEQYGKPVCVLTYVETEGGVVEGRGSGRSVAGIHIAQAFIDARNAGIIEKGGGHAMAGGFTILPERLDEFKAFMTEHVSKQAASAEANVETDIDGILSVQGTNTDFIRMVYDQVGPFGQDYPEPLFMFKNVRIHTADIVGDSHIRLMISDWEGGKRIKAMAFRAVGTELGNALLHEGRRSFDLAGHLKVDNWNGRDNVEMHVRDGRFHGVDMSGENEASDPQQSRAAG